MEICKKTPVLNCDITKYTNVLFINNKLFFLDSINKKISIYDLCFNQVACIKTPYVYTNAIKGNCGNLFLTRKDDNKTIYIATKCFIEIDKICLNIPHQYISEIIYIAYDNKKKKIIIATRKTVYSVTIDGDFIKEELSEETIQNICNKKINYINCKDLYGKMESSSKTTCELNISCIGIFCNILYVAYSKNNSAFISSISSNGNIINTFYIDDNIRINTILSIYNIMTLLITKKESYNYIYITCKKCEKNKCGICKIKCSCNCCDHSLKSCDCNCEKCEIIKSIANIESSLSYILNAEGEKIQKIVKHSNNTNELLKINDSVSDTINNISLLEHILSNKLKITLNKKK